MIFSPAPLWEWQRHCLSGTPSGWSGSVAPLGALAGPLVWESGREMYPHDGAQHDARQRASKELATQRARELSLAVVASERSRAGNTLYSRLLGRDAQVRDIQHGQLYGQQEDRADTPTGVDAWHDGTAGGPTFRRTPGVLPRPGQPLASRTAVQVYRRGVGTDQGDEWVPEACTLPTVERPLRVAEFDELFASAVEVERVSSPELRVVVHGVAAERVLDLTAKENSCCSFFEFEVVEVCEEVTLTVQVPPAHVAVLDAFAGRAARGAAA